MIIDYMKLDTNPYDVNPDDMTVAQLMTSRSAQNDTLGAIEYINEELGFSVALYEKMLETTALMGKQTQENTKYLVSWKYHPDNGLEVIYEKNR